MRKLKLSLSLSGLFFRHRWLKRLSAGVLAAVMLVSSVALSQVALARKSAEEATRKADAETVNALDPNNSAKVTAPWSAESEDSQEIKTDEPYSDAYLKATSAIEAKDYQTALKNIEECERLASNASQQAAALALEGNVYIYQGEYEKALGAYSKIQPLQQESFTPAELYYMKARCRLLLDEAQGAADECSAGIQALQSGDKLAADLYVLRGTADMRLGSYAAAADDFRSAIKSGYQDSETLYEQISLCSYLTGDYADSIKTGEKTGDGSKDSNNWMALSYYAMKLYDQAADAYEQLLKSDQTYYTKAQIYSCIAKCRIYLAQYDAAIDECNAGIKTGDKSELPTLYSLLGMAYMAKGDNLSAAKNFDLAISKGYQDAETLNTQAAACYYFGGDYDAAVRCGLTALKGASGDTEAVLWVGLSYYMQQDYQKAVDYLNRSLNVQQVYCETSEISRILTRCYLLDGKYEAASDAATQGLKMEGSRAASNPMTNEMYALRAASYLSQGKYSDALKDFYSAIAMGYSNAFEIYKQCTLCNFLLGDYQQAVSCGERALDNGEGTAELYYWIGISYFSLEEYDKAKSELELAKSLDDNQKNLYFYLGVCCFSQKAYQEAADDFTVSIDRNETAERCTYNRALCMLQLDQYDKAKEDLKAAASQTSDASVAADATDLMEKLQSALG